MTISSNKSNHYKTIKNTCYGANIIYLIVHVFYLILFIIAKAYALIFIDAAVILFYGACFFLIKKKKYYLYALLCGNEYIAFVSAATIMLGFNSGFHFYLIGLSVVSFFTAYFSKNRRVSGSIVWVGLSIAVYLALYFITKYNKPLYDIPNWLEGVLFTLHAIGVFAFVAVYMYIFLRYAFSLEKRITNESRTDELTQISNRYGLYDYYESQKEKSSLLIALFDIDDFKNINDTYGHVTGDYILKRVAEITTEVLNGSFVCRYGGEEFVAVLNQDEQKSSVELLETLRKTIAEQVFEFNKAKINITITIGASGYIKGLSLDKWVELADKKMYTGKNSGKNKVVF